MESTEVFTRVIDEVKSLTANAVAKKQDAAKLNFPTIIEKIKVRAAKGSSQLSFSTNELNEYDKRLLEQEGFKVSLEDRPKSGLDIYTKIAQYNPLHDTPKIWVVKW